MTFSVEKIKELIDQINGTHNIKVLGNTEVREAVGNDRLEKLVIGRIGHKESETMVADALYIFIGSKPFTDWIGKEVIRNE